MSEKSKKGQKSKDNLKPIFIGDKKHPFPVLDYVMEQQADGSTIARKTWTIYNKKANQARNQVAIYSEKDSKEVLALLYRNLPKPSMLKIFWDGCVNRMPESRRRLEFIKGYPGAGKTFMAGLHSELRTGKKPIKVDCGGRNLQELLWETVIDFGSDKNFYEELEARGAAGQLNPFSKKILKEALGEAYVEGKDGGVVFLWDRLGNADSVKGRDNNYMEKVQDALTKVRQFEGLESANSNALGLRMVPGVIFQAFQDNVPLILDEYNKSKDGTDDAMQTVLQFINGETDEVTVNSPMKDNSEGGQSYTLRREDMGDLFFVTATGNAVVDGVSTRPLSESANQRWQPVTIPNSTEEDWHHAWTQFATGVPISTLYQLGMKRGVNEFDKKPEKFKKYLMAFLTEGLDDNQKATMNEEYVDFIKSWKPVMDDFEELSKFCHKWATLLDPANESFNVTNDDGVLEEIEEPEYKAEVAMGYRKIIKWLEEVRQNIPAAVSPEQATGLDDDIEDFFADYEFEEGFLEPISLNYGDRLREVIKREIIRTTVAVGKKHTFTYLRDLAANHRMISKQLDSGRLTNQKLVGSALNISPLRGFDIESKAEILQRELSEYIRVAMPTKSKGKSDEELVSLSKMKALVQHLETMDALEVDADNPNARDILFINDDENSQSRRPLSDGRTFDETPVANNNNSHSPSRPRGTGPYGSDSGPSTWEQDSTPKVNEPVKPTADELVDETNFLTTLVLPVVGDVNLRSVWNKAITNSGQTADAVEDRSVKMAEDRDPAGLAITTVMVRSDRGRETPVHLVKNTQTGKVLVIGNDVSKELQHNFALARMQYVSRHEDDAAEKIKEALYEVAGDSAREIDTSLKMAFLMRNQEVQSGKNDEQRSLSSLLVDSKVESFHKHYLTKKGGRLLRMRAA
ncbi:MAG: hypothetical protein CMP22_00015 [Rickettsiales bacterium]|nr:hypothetical protein [Rickettsiales bacterium]